MTGSPAIVVTLSWPPEELSPNFRSRSHWPRTKAIAAYRYEAKIEGRRVGQLVLHSPATLTKFGTRPLRPPVTADVVFTYTAGRGHDGDNHIAMLKSAFDGLVDSGLLPGDSADLLTINPPTFVKGPRRGVTIALTETPL